MGKDELKYTSSEHKQEVVTC